MATGRCMGTGEETNSAGQTRKHASKYTSAEVTDGVTCILSQSGGLTRCKANPTIDQARRTNPLRESSVIPGSTLGPPCMMWGTRNRVVRLYDTTPMSPNWVRLSSHRTRFPLTERGVMLRL